MALLSDPASGSQRAAPPTHVGPSAARALYRGGHHGQVITPSTACSAPLSTLLGGVALSQGYVRCPTNYSRVVHNPKRARAGAKSSHG